MLHTTSNAENLPSSLALGYKLMLTHALACPVICSCEVCRRCVVREASRVEKHHRFSIWYVVIAVWIVLILHNWIVQIFGVSEVCR